ncbi:MAG: hypothetical protein WBP28_11300 [Nostocoides sp.]
MSGIIDLAVAVSADTPQITLGIPTTVTVTLTSVGTAPTSGTVTLTIFKPAIIVTSIVWINFPSGWTIVSESLATWQVTRTAPIMPGEVINFIYEATKTDFTNGFTTIRGIITNGSGGDTNTANNSAFLRLNHGVD